MKKFRCGIIPAFISLRKSKVLLAMKLTILVFLIGIMQSFAFGTYAQVTKLNLKMQNSSIKDVLAQVEEKTEFYFLYNSKLVDVERKVTVSGSDMTITDLLNQLFADGRVTYNIVDRQIVLSSREMTAPPPATQQQGAVTGKVTDRVRISPPRSYRSGKRNLHRNHHRQQWQFLPHQCTLNRHAGVFVYWNAFTRSRSGESGKD